MNQHDIQNLHLYPHGLISVHAHLGVMGSVCILVIIPDLVEEQMNYSTVTYISQTDVLCAHYSKYE